MSEDRVRLSYEGPVAIITNDNQDKHNAFDDSMDARLFEILAELRNNPDVRVAIWRAEGKSFSSGRDVSQIGRQQMEMSHHQLMTRGHRGIQQVFDLDIPILVANHGWTIGGSFQRTLLCDVRIAAEGARFMLPELTHGVIADTGGVACLFQMCGHGVVSDMVLTGRPLLAEEALRYGVISRIVPREELDTTVREMADKIAKIPPVSVKLARRVIRNLHEPEIRTSMNDELLMQTVINKAPDFEELKAARGEERDPKFPGVWVKPATPAEED
ncbi:MAG: enoyl-CoA hydratase/isomerase family protein [Candidatus Binatia bacterium]|nr:enoyl-CoA hydratase/isomerase family protein [Candidatus Binatia bacterium]